MVCFVSLIKYLSWDTLSWRICIFKKTSCCTMCLEMLLHDICYAGSLNRKEGRRKEGSLKRRAALGSQNLHFFRKDTWLPAFSVAVYDHTNNRNIVAEDVLHWWLRHDSYYPTASKLTLSKSLTFFSKHSQLYSSLSPFQQSLAPAQAPCLCLILSTTHPSCCGPQTPGLGSLAGTLRKWDLQRHVLSPSECTISLYLTPTL